MQKLIKTYQQLLTNLPEVYPRKVYKNLESGHRITGIVGPRGIGKTTYILHFLKEKYKNNPRALYVLADDLYFTDHNLLDLVEEFVNKYNGQLLCIDEIHKYPNWAQELKNIYDQYFKLKIIFSGSSAIDLIKQKYDLSRRAALRHLPGLSFREYLEIRQGKKYPTLSLKKIIQKRITSVDEILKTPKLLGLFEEYLKIGYYPIFTAYKKEAEIHEAILGIIEKSVYIDVASSYKLKTSTLPIFKKLLYFIYTSEPGSINVNRIAKSLHKDHTDVSTYLEMLRDTGLLRFLLIDKLGHALIRNTEKVYLNNTNLAYAFRKEIKKEINKGALRELFVISQLESAGYKVFYSNKGDISVISNKDIEDDKEYIFEIGGKNKTEDQIKKVNDPAFLVLDDVLHGDKHSIPMYLFGFLY